MDKLRYIDLDKGGDFDDDDLLGIYDFYRFWDKPRPTLLLHTYTEAAFVAFCRERMQELVVMEKTDIRLRRVNVDNPYAAWLVAPGDIAGSLILPSRFVHRIDDAVVASAVRTVWQLVGVRPRHRTSYDITVEHEGKMKKFYGQSVARQDGWLRAEFGVTLTFDADVAQSIYQPDNPKIKERQGFSDRVIGLREVFPQVHPSAIKETFALELATSLEMELKVDTLSVSEDKALKRGSALLTDESWIVEGKWPRELQ